MPNRNVHLPVGRAAGVATAGYLAKDEDWFLILLRASGGYLGGKAGALAPDIIDPSSNGPNHRSIGHGIVPLSSIALLGKDALTGLRNKLMEWAEKFDRGRFPVFTWLCHFAIGLIDGFLAGYLSHVALDSMTPKGLPVIA